MLLTLTLALLAGPAHAVELGDAAVRSYIGQPLVADVELTMLSDPAGRVLVRLSSPDVYRGANISMNPLLSNLSMSVMKRDNRQFLHITSTKQLDSEYIHLFLDLSHGGKTNVRAVTLWLTRDPAPPAPPAPMPVPVPVPVPVPAAASLPPPARALAAAPAPAIRMRAEPAPAACPPQKYTAEQIKVCSTLDYKNGLLSAQIVELEEKVKLLQLAIEGKQEGAAAHPTPPASHGAPVAAIAPLIKAPVAIKPELPKKDKAPDSAKAPDAAHAGPPWLWIGIAAGLVLLLAGGGAFWFVRRRRRKKDPVMPTAGGAEGASDIAAIVSPEDRADYMAKLKESLQRKKKEAAGG